MYAAPTEASWSRSAKLTEFQRVKEAVRRLEHTAREQLALERESQNVFDFLKAEITRIKRSIGALSSVVDEELVSLRGECAALRDEVARAVDLAKSQTDRWASHALQLHLSCPPPTRPGTAPAPLHPPPAPSQRRRAHRRGYGARGGGRRVGAGQGRRTSRHAGRGGGPRVRQRV